MITSFDASRKATVDGVYLLYALTEACRIRIGRTLSNELVKKFSITRLVGASLFFGFSTGCLRREPSHTQKLPKQWTF